MNLKRLFFSKSLSLLVFLAAVCGAQGAYNNDRFANTIVVNGDADTYYPVAFNIPNDGMIYDLYIGRLYSMQAPSAWYLPTHKGGLSFHIRLTSNSWGGNPAVMDIQKHEYSYSTQIAKVEYSRHGYEAVIWLRGGGALYQLSGSLPNIASPEIYYETTQTYDHSNDVHDTFVSPTTEVTLGKVDYGTIYSKDGKFGFGEPNPDDKLHVLGHATVEGDLAVTGSLDVNTIYADYLGSSAGIVAEGSNAGLWTGSRLAPYGVDTNSFRIEKSGIRTDFTDRNSGADEGVMRFMNGGNIGIGTTYDPLEDLSIYGEGGSSEVSFGIGPAATRKWVFRTPGYESEPTLGAYPLILEQDAGGFSGDFSIRGLNSNFVFKWHGRFGVGTEIPEGQAHIMTGESGYNPVGVPTLLVENGGTSNSSYVFQTMTNGGGRSFNISNAGNVGIGIDEPLDRLDIDGNVRVSNGHIRLINPSMGTAGYINWLANAKMSFGSLGGDEFVVDRSNNRIGLGTASPDKDFVLERAGSAILKVETTSTNGFAALRVKANPGGTSRLDFASPSNVDTGQIRYSHSDERMYFRVGDGDRMSISSDGNMSIGTTKFDNTDNAMLSVGGKIRAEEIVVKLQVDWADYVFEDGYNLRSLDEVETHIAAHGHLPGVPSAAEIAEQGVSIGDNQRILMEKIEELTLYTIDQNKRLDEKDRQIAELMAMNARILKTLEN